MTTLTSRSGQLYVTIEGREYPTLVSERNAFICIANNQFAYSKGVRQMLESEGIQIPDELVEIKDMCADCKDHTNCQSDPCHRKYFAVLKPQDQKKEVEEIEWPGDEEISQASHTYADKYRDYGNHKAGFAAGQKAMRDELSRRYNLTLKTTNHSNT